MSWYSDADARFDAWVTGNWGEDSVSDDYDDDYDAADSQIKTGVMAREAAGDLEDAILALEEAQKNAYDDDLGELIEEVKRLRDFYRGQGDLL